MKSVLDSKQEKLTCLSYGRYSWSETVSQSNSYRILQLLILTAKLVYFQCFPATKTHLCWLFSRHYISPTVFPPLNKPLLIVFLTLKAFVSTGLPTKNSVFSIYGLNLCPYFDVFSFFYQQIKCKASIPFPANLICFDFSVTIYLILFTAM